MNAHLELLRINVCLLASLGVLVGGLVVGLSSPVPLSFLVALVVVFIICGAGNIINDYFDHEVDSMHKFYRPIPSGRITRKMVNTYAIILFVLGNLLSLVFLDQFVTIFVVINSFIAWLYSAKIKRTVYGHFVDSWLAASAFIFGGLVAGEITIPLLILAGIAFLGNFGREVVKGIEDYKSDKKIGLKTLEVVLRKPKAKFVAIVSVVLAVMISPIPYLLGMNIWYLLVVGIADLFFLYSLRILNNAAKAQKIMKVAMFIAMLGFLVGVLV